MTFDFRGWVRQPSTITGIGAAVADITVLIPGYLNGTTPLWAAVGAAVYAAVHLILPDNTQAAADAETLAIDLIKGVATKTMNVAIPNILSDLTRLVADIVPPRPVTVTPVAVFEPAAGPGAIPVAMIDGLGPMVPVIRAQASTAAGIGLALVLTLSACGMPPVQPAQIQAGIQTGETLACLIDGVAHPIAGPALAALLPQASVIIGIDAALVHPLVVDFCAGVGGTPVKTVTPPDAASALLALAH